MRRPAPPALALLTAWLTLACGSGGGDSGTNAGGPGTTGGTGTTHGSGTTGGTGTTHGSGTTGSSGTTHGSGTTGSSGTTQTTTGNATVSYAADVAPIFEGRCTDCHHRDATAIPNMVDPFDPSNGLIAFANTWYESYPETPEMNVAPGDPANSFLLQKIAGTTSAGEAMPWSPTVTDDERANLREWVAQGALNDTFYESNIRRIFGTPGVLGAPGGKCAYCHHPTGISPDLSNPFDPENGVVNVAATVEGWTRVVPGDPDSSLLIALVEATETIEAGDPMPKVYPPLTAEEVATVTQWILEGAQNN